MKGPGFRIDLDVRRLWECSACGRRLKMPGDVAQLTCDCRSDNPPVMRLVEKLRRTESPFDHVGYAAQKRIDAAIRKPPEPLLPETTHAIDADAPQALEAVEPTEGDKPGA